MKVSLGGAKQISWRKSIDILTAFAKGVLYRESGVLNGYRPVADIFEDCRERELEEGLIDFIKN